MRPGEGTTDAESTLVNDQESVSTNRGMDEKTKKILIGVGIGVGATVGAVGAVVAAPFALAGKGAESDFVSCFSSFLDIFVFFMALLFLPSQCSFLSFKHFILNNSIIIIIVTAAIMV